MRFDPAFHQMLIGSLLVCDHTKRRAALFPKLFLALFGSPAAEEDLGPVLVGQLLGVRQGEGAERRTAKHRAAQRFSCSLREPLDLSGGEGRVLGGGAQPFGAAAESQ